jgi:hypothetical protein
MNGTSTVFVGLAMTVAAILVGGVLLLLLQAPLPKRHPISVHATELVVLDFVMIVFVTVGLVLVMVVVLVVVLDLVMVEVGSVVVVLRVLVVDLVMVMVGRTQVVTVALMVSVVVVVAVVEEVMVEETGAGVETSWLVIVNAGGVEVLVVTS